MPSLDFSIIDRSDSLYVRILLLCRTASVQNITIESMCEINRVEGKAAIAGREDSFRVLVNSGNYLPVRFSQEQAVSTWLLLTS